MAHCSKVLAASTGLTFFISLHAAIGDGPDRVVVRTESDLKVSDQTVDRVVPGQPLNVLRREEGWLYVSRGKPGWIKESSTIAFADAVEFFQSQIQSGGSLRSYFALGLVLLETERFEEAISQFEQASRIAPNQAAPLEALGLSYVRAQNPAKGLEFFDKAVKLNPTSNAAKLGRGRALLELHQHADAIDAFGAAIERDRRNALPWTFRGIAYLETGRLDAAIADLDQALKLDPYDATARSARGRTHCLRGEFEAGRKDFAYLGKIGYTDTETLTGLGIANHGMGNIEAALASFAAAVRSKTEFSQEDAYLWSNLGQASIEAGHAEKGYEYLSYAIKLDANFAEAYAHRAIHLATRDELSGADLEQAKDDASRAYRLDNESFWSNWAIAETYRAFGNHTRAAVAARNALMAMDASIPARFRAPLKAMTEQSENVP